MKFAAAVILYNPSEKEIKNINTYLNSVEEVLIYDNTENGDNTNLLDYLNSNNYTYIKNQGNEGLCKPLNKALDHCIEKKYDFLLTMDQDSYFLKENIEKYLEDIINFSNLETVGQFGLTYEKVELKYENLGFYESKSYLITSSSMININQINNFNIRFDENLFIDCLDYDFSFNLILHGLRNILFTDNYFVHNIGEPIKRASYKSLFLIKKKKTIHSEIRMYYINRNTMYLQNKYANTKLSKYSENYRNIMKKYLETCLSYSKNYFKAKSLLKKGANDFKHNIMGKLIQ
jgi:rhamnosyltransferase